MSEPKMYKVTLTVECLMFDDAGPKLGQAVERKVVAAVEKVSGMPFAGRLNIDVAEATIAPECVEDAREVLKLGKRIKFLDLQCIVLNLLGGACTAFNFVWCLRQLRAGHPFWASVSAIGVAAGCWGLYSSIKFWFKGQKNG